MNPEKLTELARSFGGDYSWMLQVFGVVLKVSEIIASHGAEVAFPTTTVHMPEQLSCCRPQSRVRHRNADHGTLTLAHELNRMPRDRPLAHACAGLVVHT